MRFPSSPMNQCLMARLMLSVLGLCVSLGMAGPIFQAEAQASERIPKKVFGHYMVCFSPTGGGDSLGKLKQEIREAQQRGLDGFALNCGGWSLREPHYKRRVQEIYQAAQELGTGFQLMISADFCCGLTFEEVEDMVESFRDHPNQFRNDGKPVFSTFDGDADLSKFIAKKFVAERAITFVPFYYPEPANELPGEAEIEQVFGMNPTVDGFFYFGAAGSPESIAETTRKMASKWKGAGKIFMAPVTPFYRGLNVNYRVFEPRGFEGLIMEWMAAIESDADWVELVTWNDWTESTYMSPLQPPAFLPHSGYLDLSAYFIQWFKEGLPPKVTRDEIFYAYRLHPRTLSGRANPSDAATAQRPAGAETLSDQFYVTTLLTAPATLEVEIAGRTSRFACKSGLTNVQLPLKDGQPVFRLIRDEEVEIEKKGEMAVSSNSTESNFNYFAGSAVGTAPP